MTFDPYAVLGVDSEATYAEIKAAHRKMAKQYHPDAGGDEDQFAKVNLAWNILKAPETRNEYDRTGDTGNSEPDNTVAGAVAILVGIICSIVDKCMVDGVDPCSIDLITTLRATIAEQVRQVRSKQEKPVKLATGMDRVIARFKKKNDKANPLLMRALNEQAAHLKEIVKSSNVEIDACNRALTILLDYEFKPEVLIRLMGTGLHADTGTVFFKL